MGKLNTTRKLESTKAEIGEVTEENERLRQHLNQVMKDYQTLQRRFHEISQQDNSKQGSDNRKSALPPQASRDNIDDDDDEAKLVSLSLGRTSSQKLKKVNADVKLITNPPNDEQGRIRSKSINNNVDDEARERSLDLGLECKFKASSSTIDRPQIENPNLSPNNSFDETKDGEGVKNNKNNVASLSSGDDEVVHQPPMKKARVSVRVRCDGPTMNDGCQWRKYGQKIAKGNPCPRAYYRCTVAPSCPVRKQVQRCAEDMSILITTYEGAHNHPLPVSATAMASTTSAAAYLLMSKSSSSSNATSHPSTTSTTTTTTADLHGDVKFNILENSKLPNPYYLPNSSTLFSHVTTPTHPTVTLDLTSPSSLSSTNQFNRVNPNNLGPRYSSTNNLNFNFSNNNSTNLLNSWPNSSLPSYGTQSFINKITQDNSPLNNLLGSSSTNNNNPYNFQTNSLLQNSISSHSNPPNHDYSLPDTIAQAAKALTSDPSFQSILTKTLSSFISGNNGNNSGIHHTSSFANSTFESTNKET
ncbi:putative WRKY transcription factor 72, partial [Bienertia sinuspersici]